MKYRILLPAVVVSLCSLSCKTTKKVREYRVMDTVSVSAYNNPATLYRESAPQDWKLLHTRVALSFDYNQRSATGKEWVTLQPYCYAADSLVLDAKGMQIEKVTAGLEDKVLSFTYDSTLLKIRLDRTYTRHEELKLYIQYKAYPYGSAGGGSAAITDDRGLYFINTDRKIKGKPVQIWTQGETESNSRWLPTIDKPNSRTTIQLELTVPSAYATLSNGARISSMDNGIHRTDIWKTDEPIQVYAIMFAIGDFSVAKDSWEGKEVNYYVEPAYAPYARKMFQHTPEMIGFFSRVTGVSFPWNKYSQIVVRDYVSGAMENTSASLFGEFMNQDFREYADGNHEDVVSHELFHQWFGDYVTAESWSHLTVNESFATYGEYLWRRYKYGLHSADELAYNDLQRYLNAAVYTDPVLVRHYYKENEDMFDRVSYQKGSAILRYLHHLVGDTAFYRAMQIYLQENALQSAEATHWRLAVEKASGKDWNWFFDQWYYRAGHPELDIRYHYDDQKQQLIAEVRQLQATDPYRLPLEVLLISGDQSRMLRWDLTKRREQFVYNYENGQAPVLVPDVSHMLPGTLRENKTYAQYLQQMRHTDDYISHLSALKQIAVKDLGQGDVVAMLRLGIQHKVASIRLYTVQLLQQATVAEVQNKWMPDIRHLAGQDGNNQVRAAAVAVLGEWKNKERQGFFLETLTDSSYLVASKALEALYSIDDTLAYRQAKKMLNGRPDTYLDREVWRIIALSAKPQDFSLFEQGMQAMNTDDYRQAMPQNLAVYAAAVGDDTLYKRSVDLLKNAIGFFEFKNTRQYIVLQLLTLRRRIDKKDKTGTQMSKAFRLACLKEAAQKLEEKETEESIRLLYREIYR